MKIYALGDIQLISPVNIITSHEKIIRYQAFDTDYDDNVRRKLQDTVSRCRKFKSQELLTLEKIPQDDDGNLKNDRS